MKMLRLKARNPALWERYMFTACAEEDDVDQMGFVMGATG